MQHVYCSVPSFTLNTTQDPSLEDAATHTGPGLPASINIIKESPVDTATGPPNKITHGYLIWTVPHKDPGDSRLCQITKPNKVTFRIQICFNSCCAHSMIYMETWKAKKSQGSLDRTEKGGKTCVTGI